MITDHKNIKVLSVPGYTLLADPTPNEYFYKITALCPQAVYGLIIVDTPPNLVTARTRLACLEESVKALKEDASGEELSRITVNGLNYTVAKHKLQDYGGHYYNKYSASLEEVVCFVDSYPGGAEDYLYKLIELNCRYGDSLKVV